MNRWKITRAQAPTSSGKIWQVWEGDQRRKVLITWAEAMDYANQRARTIEVTLPPVVEHPSDDVPGPTWNAYKKLSHPWVSVVGGQVWRTDRRGSGEVIGPDIAEGTGLALLAAAKCAKGELP